MSLAFLTPDGAGETVVARSPMERRARRAGAQIELRDGWNVATAYAGAGPERGLLDDHVAFVDRSNLLKIELQAEPAVLAEAVAAVSAGPPLEPGRAVYSRAAWWCPVTPSRVLVLGEPEMAAETRAAVLSTDAGATDLTCGLAALALAGPGAHELLARFCAIDVRPAITPVGGFRPGSVARTPGYVLRDGHQRLLVLVGWALGEYLWTVVADAAERLGGGPAGADALAAWSRESDAAARSRESGAAAGSRESGAAAGSRESGAAAGSRESGPAARSRESGAAARSRESGAAAPSPDSDAHA